MSNGEDEKSDLDHSQRAGPTILAITAPERHAVANKTEYMAVAVLTTLMSNPRSAGRLSDIAFELFVRSMFRTNVVTRIHGIKYRSSFQRTAASSSGVYSKSSITNGFLTGSTSYDASWAGRSSRGVVSPVEDAEDPNKGLNGRFSGSFALIVAGDGNRNKAGGIKGKRLRGIYCTYKAQSLSRGSEALR